MEQIVNTVKLRGTMEDLPKFSHENHGKKFYSFSLRVSRLSGAQDILPVIVWEELLQGLDPSGGEMITVVGQIRSHNLRTDNARHLLVFVYASFIAAEDGEPMNEVLLSGLCCKDPVFRRTPLGREICDVMLAVPRAFRRADYLPCILWGKLAQEAADCHVRDQIVLSGRLQSRVYTKVTDDAAIEHTTYEISALTASFYPQEDQQMAQ